MKKNALFLLILLVGALQGCHSPEDQARTLIQKSIKAHGGQERWDEIKEFQFIKKSTLYLEDGSEESSQEQLIQFKLHPYFEAKMSWEKDSMLHRVSFDGLKTRYSMGANEIQNEGFLAAKKKEIDAAFYVMDKPFALLQGSKNLRYQGLVTLADQRELECIEVIDGDPQDPTTDRWWYYFHPENHELVAYKVKTNDHYSLVYNLEMDRSLKVAFPMKRESFRIDSVGKILYLRASYEFKNYERLD
jgi:hypothetical protein